jgi:uncharacterized membrane protein (DUF485 family)
MSDAIRQSGSLNAPGAWVEGIHGVEFKTLIDAKRRTIVPMLVSFIVGYMGLSVLAGLGRGILGVKVLGSINLGFVLIAANYLMSWVIAVAYARISASSHDPLVKIVIEKARANGNQP